MAGPFKTKDEKSTDGEIFLADLLNDLPCMVYRCRHDHDDRTMSFVSEGSAALLGYEPSELLTNRVRYRDIIHPEDREMVWKKVEKAIRDRQAFNVVYRVDTAAGKQKWVCDQGKGLFSQSGDLVGLEGCISDVSDHKIGQGKRRRRNLVLRTVWNVNHLLVKEKDVNRVIQGACDILVENRGYFNAWIALFDASGSLTHMAGAGLEKQLSSLKERLRKGMLTRCIQKVLTQLGSLLIEDPLSTCDDCPLSHNYTGRAGITACLRYGGRTYGVLSASIPKHLLENKEEQALFEDISDDIAFALHKIQLNEQREESQKELQDAGTYVRENPYPVFRIEYDGTILLANEGSRNVLEKWGLHSGEKVPGDWLEIVRAALDSGIRKEFEMEVEDEVYFFSMVPVEGRDYVNIYGLDVTRRKKMEKALATSEEAFRNLVESSLVGISLVQDGDVIYRNPEQERIWGPVMNGTYGFCFDDVHPDDTEKVHAMLQQVLNKKSPLVDMELRVFVPEDANGRRTMRWMHCRTSLLQHLGKETLLINMIDITNIKELEKLLTIEDKMSSLGRVAAGIAHEIRNPLSGINVYLDTLRQIYNKPENEEDVLNILTRAKSASGKIESVIRRVMDFAKPGAPNYVLSDINGPVEEAVKLASVTLRKIGVDVDITLSPHIPKCLIDSQMIESAVLNLITNAAEAMRQSVRQKKIEIASSTESGRLFLTVSDSGPGVKPELQEKIFDPFYTDKSSGTGIGLSICRRIVADHGGVLSLSESKWGGAKFTIEIPFEKGKNGLW